MNYLLISILGMLLGCWAVWRLVSINCTKEANYLHGPVKKPNRYSGLRGYQPTKNHTPDQGKAQPRGMVLPSKLVGTSYRTQHPNFWTEEEP